MDLLEKSMYLIKKNIPIILVGTTTGTEWLMKCFPGINLPLFHGSILFICLERILTIPGNIEVMATKNPGVVATPDSTES